MSETPEKERLNVQLDADVYKRLKTAKLRTGWSLNKLIQESIKKGLEAVEDDANRDPKVQAHLEEVGAIGADWLKTKQRAG